MWARCTFRRTSPGDASFPRSVSRFRKIDHMATAQPTSNFGVLPIGPIGYPDDFTVTRYKRELALHISEEIRLKVALARAEALLRQRGTAQQEDSTRRAVWQKEAADCVARLTPRQHEIMELVLAGHPSKNIAADLGISQRTVENHRAAIMKKTGSKSLPALGRFGFAAPPAIVPGRARNGFASSRPAQLSE
jgi:hypothetical protein